MLQLFSQLGPLLTGSLWMGLWAAAAALPLLIHLLNRRQYRQETWAAMEYLLRAMKKNSRRIQIEQLLLLIVRIAILLFATLAWMDLMWSHSSFGTATGGNSSTHTVLLIDGSYSMGTINGKVTCYDRSRQLAQKIVDASSRGDAFTIVQMAQSPQVVIGQPAFDPKDVKDELENLQLLHTGANLAASLATVEKMLRDVREDHARLKNQRLCIFTDLGRSTWGSVNSDDVQARLQHIAEKASITLFDVGRDDVENLAVSDLRLRESYVALNKPTRLQSRIKNFGGTDRNELSVQLLVDEHLVAEESINVPAGDEATVVFQHRFNTPGEHIVQVQLPSDVLPLDDARRLSVPVHEMLNVLCVSGKPGAADHVRLALTPQRKSDATLQVELATESAILERELANYDCIFLCNIGRFGQDEARVLHQFVSSGGGLIIFLGDQVIPESYNRTLDPNSPDALMMMAKIGKAKPVGEYRFDPKNYAHPIVDAFRGHQRTGLLTTPIWKYHPLELPEDSTAKVALWFDTGDPAVVEKSIGRGRSILVATAASAESFDRTTNPPTPWTALSSWPSFPPLVHEMMKVAVSGKHLNRNVQVGQLLASSVDSTALDISLVVHPPDQAPQRVRLQLEGESSAWSFSDTQRSGIYQASFSEPITRTEFYAVNLDVRESDPTRFNPDKLPEHLQQELEQTETGLDNAALSGPRWHIFRWFLGAVVVLLLAETYLAWHFGNRSI